MMMVMVVLRKGVSLCMMLLGQHLSHLMLVL